MVLPMLWLRTAILFLLGLFILWKTGKIGSVSPMRAIRGETESAALQKEKLPPIGGNVLRIPMFL